MGDRWQRVSDLLSHTHKTCLTSIDLLHRALLFSITGEDVKMRELLSDQREKECEERWKALNLPETKIKWSHVNGDDRMDCVKENEVVSKIIDALIMLNSVRNGHIRFLPSTIILYFLSKELILHSS